MQARATKERIVDAAIHLWNRAGVGPVTTNHIAAHLEMSPGNLYYHFKNKEEIVRAAFERMSAEADEVWRIPPGESPGPLTLHRMLTGNIQLYVKYIFFARELSALVRADPALKKRYRKIQEERVRELTQAVRALVKAGVLENVAPADVSILVDNAWIIGVFGIPSAELAGRADTLDGEIAYGARQVLHLFKPYMPRAAYEVLDAAVEAGVELTLERLRERAQS